MNLKPIFCLYFFMIFLAGCNTTLTKPRYVVEVNSISSPEEVNSVGDKIAYRLVPGNEGVSPNDLQYREYAEYVRRALDEHGYYEGRIPDIVVGFSYGIEGPIQRVSSQGTLYDVHRRNIILAGFSLAAPESDDVQVLWKTTISSTGSSGDLRKVLPVMLGAALPYITKNTGERITVETSEESESVKIVKGLTSNEKNP